MSEFIPYGKQYITEADIEAVTAVLRSDWLTQGPVIQQFETALASKCHAKHGIAVTNATAGLHLACIAAGLGQGDRLWTVPNTFVASANAGLYCGATVDFVDIDPTTFCMDVDKLAEKLELADKNGTLPKIIIPVHFAGHSCNMQRIGALAKQYGITVIEDAAHAVGGHYKNQPVGCGQYSDMTVFSFHPVKIITTAEGGMVLTNNDALADKLQRLRTHGITRDEHLMTEPSHGAWYYQQIELGYNTRMTELQAALGHSQLQRLDDIIDKRNALAEQYHTLLKDLPITCPTVLDDVRSAYHLYVIQTDNRKQVYDYLKDNKIGCQIHYIPVHLQPYYQNLGFKKGDYPVAEAYYERCLSLPLFPQLTAEQQQRVVATLSQALTTAPV